MRRLIRSLIIALLFAMYGNADDIDIEVHSGQMLKILRGVANKTNATDSLNLPANASSIRENITDTFSCENRTYGYYADVDNECQVFHVCLPSNTPSGRNVTYRWSFICPNETIFNQEYLVCTRPSDSIPCAESPNYYHMNMEIGKTPKNDSRKTDDKGTRNEIEINEKDKNSNNYNNDRDTNKNQIQRRRPDHRKQNIIIDNLFKDVIDEEIKEKLENVELAENIEEIFPDIIANLPEDNVPEIYEVKVENGMVSEDNEARLALERSVGTTNSKKRSFRFKADI